MSLKINYTKIKLLSIIIYKKYYKEKHPKFNINTFQKQAPANRL